MEMVIEVIFVCMIYVLFYYTDFAPYEIQAIASYCHTALLGLFVVIYIVYCQWIMITGKIKDMDRNAKQKLYRDKLKKAQENNESSESDSDSEEDKPVLVNAKTKKNRRTKRNNLSVKLDTI